jgi:hypothetical protein
MSPAPIPVRPELVEGPPFSWCDIAVAQEGQCFDKLSMNGLWDCTVP